MPFDFLPTLPSDFAPYWLLIVAAFIVGMSKGGLPTVAMLSVPMLALFMPVLKAAILLLPIYIISDLVGVWLYRRNFSAVNLRILLPAGLVGILAGWAMASVVSDRVFEIALGSVGAAFCLNSWLRVKADAPAKSANRTKGSILGALAGFTSFISHAGGPPFQMYMLPQKLSKLEFAGTSTIFFAVINLSKIVPYQQLRPYSFADLSIALWLIPVAIVGTVAGYWITRILPDKWFFRLVEIGLFVLSIRLIIG